MHWIYHAHSNGVEVWKTSRLRITYASALEKHLPNGWFSISILFGVLPVLFSRSWRKIWTNNNSLIVQSSVRIKCTFCHAPFRLQFITLCFAHSTKAELMRMVCMTINTAESRVIAAPHDAYHPASPTSIELSDEFDVHKTERNNLPSGRDGVGATNPCSYNIICSSISMRRACWSSSHEASLGPRTIPLNRRFRSWYLDEMYETIRKKYNIGTYFRCIGRLATQYDRTPEL